MKQLDVVRALSETFVQRGLRQHAGSRGIRSFLQATPPAHVVCDIELGHAILGSGAFEAFDPFEPGYRRLAERGRSLELIEQYFHDAPLCLEGERMRAVKRELGDLLREQGEVLEASVPRIRAWVRRRRPAIDSPLAFATTVVEGAVASVIADLLAIRFEDALAPLRRRRNVFFFHFHRLRHEATNAALELLRDAAPARVAPARMLLAQSLLVMGYDPLVATICASLVDGHEEPFDAGAGRYCPVSAVSRRCVQTITLGGFRFAAGDVCYVALLPGTEEIGQAGMPFGSGAHTCVGKRLALHVLRIAEAIHAEVFEGGFRALPVIACDGTFLAFREEGVTDDGR
ncbi:MAG: hypothetical protein ACU85V_21095 [Gammaproteobacteria bacterium]